MRDWNKDEEQIRGLIWLDLKLEILGSRLVQGVKCRKKSLRYTADNRQEILKALKERTIVS
jgi:hypothetical protein